MAGEGHERAKFRLKRLPERGCERVVSLAFAANTPYVNTIPVAKQPPYAGDRDVERRIKSITRWNAMAMVVRANKKFPGLGGHISTFASAATLYQVGLHHFLRGRGFTGGAGGAGFGRHLVHFPGPASP